MKSLFAGFIAFTIASCVSPNNAGDYSDTGDIEKNSVVTMLFVENLTVDGMKFLKFQMNPATSYITMVDSVMPSQSDSTIALCVEAAFTGELLKDFKTTNIGGDYVIDGTFHKGYKCNANTGFLYANKTIYTISPSEYCNEWIEKAQKYHGTLFQQMLLVHNGKNVYRETPIKPTTSNIYRSVCIMNDGNFAVIQSLSPLPLKNFIESLMAMGVSDALYLDMGKGWNYGWYRETVDSAPINLFDYKSPYQTNWLIIKAKD